MQWSMYGGNGQRKYLTRTETESFLAVAREQDTAVYSFCWLIAETGCRISEALATTVGNFDFESKHIIVETLKKRRSHVYRAIPLPDTMVQDFRRWIENGVLDSRTRLWPWSRMTGYRRITEVMRKARILGPWGTPKGLRHGFGVRAVHSGVPLNLVQRWLGHADMKTTAIYASAVGPEERDLAARAWLERIESLSVVNGRKH